MLIGILLVCIAVLAILLIRVERKLSKFLAGKQPKNMAESLAFLRNEIKDEHVFREEMKTYLTTVEKRLRASIQKVETVRFNPFKGTGSGGDQSFATAFLDETGTGVVISSLYSREHTSIFAKPVIKFASTHELSKEEKQVIGNTKK
jgi:hypothetical protein